MSSATSISSRTAASAATAAPRFSPRSPSARPRCTGCSRTPRPEQFHSGRLHGGFIFCGVECRPRVLRGHLRKEGVIMFRVIVAVMVLGLAGAASAQSMRKSCDELKAEIDAKIKKNGVDKFTLDVVDTEAQAEGKVVGTCDGGTKKIVYKRG